MASPIDKLALFPVVFGALVLQKTYVVSKSALVPSVVRSERDLVEANSKLGLIAGMIGFAAVIPAAILQLTPAARQGDADLRRPAVRRRSVSPRSCPPTSSPATRPVPRRSIQLHSPSVQLGHVR